MGRTRGPRHRIEIDRSISRLHHTLDYTTPMGTAQSRKARSRTTRSLPAECRPRIPVIQFRVLVIGRANAGKTSILQRVCETTESPTIYRGGEEARRLSFCFTTRVLLPIGYT